MSEKKGVKRSIEEVLGKDLPKPKEVKKKKFQTTKEIVLAPHRNFNEHLTNILSQLGEIEKNRGDVYRARAYEKAVKALKSYPKKVESASEADKLEGIGPRIAARIDEILKTGTLTQLDEEMNNEITKSINELCRVSGIGPTAARKFVDEGIKSIEDLKKNQDKLTHHQQIGLKYLEQLEKKIPRYEVQQIEFILKETLKEIDPELIGEICGSYRRGLSHSGDVDFLVTHPTKFTVKDKDSGEILAEIVRRLRRKKFLTDDISQGSVKYMGICQLQPENEIEKNLHRRIDIRMISYENYWTGLLYFTGSGYFNQQMRTIALQKGFTLSEYSICPVGEKGDVGDPVDVNSEQEIFDILGMEYKEPKDRNL